MDVNTQLTDAIFTLSRHMKERLSGELGHLTLVQLQTLAFLRKNNNITMTDIANYFKIELPSATSLINKLVKAKLVSRKEDLEDRRLVRICLTAKGEKLVDIAIKERSRKIEKNLSYLSMDDKKQLLRILQTMMTKMKDNEK